MIIYAKTDNFLLPQSELPGIVYPRYISSPMNTVHQKILIERKYDCLVDLLGHAHEAGVRKRHGNVLTTTKTQIDGRFHGYRVTIRWRSTPLQPLRYRRNIMFHAAYPVALGIDSPKSYHDYPLMARGWDFSYTAISRSALTCV